MLIDHLRRLAAPRQAVLVFMTASSLLLAVAAPALAGQPKGDFAVFGQCPLANVKVTVCIYAQSTGKEFVIGSQTVPIAHTITLQGGSFEEEPEVETFVAAANGETLSKTAQTVPSGLTGIVKTAGWSPSLLKVYRGYVDDGLTGVTATAELVGKPGISRANLLFQEGVALALPIRFHLNNAFLGSVCFIGSKASPIELELTTGTTSPPGPNQPISGAVDELEFKDDFELIIFKGNKLVDNAFSVPVAEGCGGIFSSEVDPGIDAGIGLSSAAGSNTAIIEDTMQNATAEAVKNSQTK